MLIEPLKRVKEETDWTCHWDGKLHIIDLYLFKFSLLNFRMSTFLLKIPPKIMNNHRRHPRTSIAQALCGWSALEEMPTAAQFK